MHTLIPASRPRIPIAYFRACTWKSARMCFVKFLSATPLHPPPLSVRVCLSRTRTARLVRSAENRGEISVGEFTIGNVNRQPDVKASSLLKNTGASLSCVPTKEAFDRWNETPSFVCRTGETPAHRACPVSCPAPLFHHMYTLLPLNSLFALLPTRTRIANSFAIVFVSLGHLQPSRHHPM